MSNTPVQNTKKSVKIPEVHSVQPSVQDVVKAFSTPGANQSSEDYKKIIATLMAMLMGLSFEVLNNDVWGLSLLQARTIAKKMGLDEKEFAKIAIRVLEIQKQIGKRNPMSSMF